MLQFVGERRKPFTVPFDTGELADFKHAVLGRIIAGECEPEDLSGDDED